MIHQFKKKPHPTPESNNQYQVRTTSPRKVKELILKLHPYNTQHKLIRLGPKTDGGYLIPDDLDGIEACFSPGVADVSEFEIDCIKRGMNVFMADKSVEKPNINTDESNYHFLKKFIGCTNNEDTITMDQWVSEYCPSSTSDLLLQMDIEGAEYSSILNMTDALLRRFRIMVIEFHTLHDLWNPHFYNLSKITFEKILQTHHCVHIHPNNCCGIKTHQGIEIPKVAEFTFLRKDRVQEKRFAIRFPHKLDYKNISTRFIKLPRNWYGGEIK